MHHSGRPPHLATPIPRNRRASVNLSSCWGHRQKDDCAVGFSSKMAVGYKNPILRPRILRCTNSRKSRRGATLITTHARRTHPVSGGKFARAASPHSNHVLPAPACARGHVCGNASRGLAEVPHDMFKGVLGVTKRLIKMTW